MASLMVLPKIGVNMVEATIVEWVAKLGDEIKEGQHIVTVETDKATQEIVASHSGTLVRIFAEKGQVLKCQEPLALIASQGERLSADDIKELMRNTPDSKTFAAAEEMGRESVEVRENSGVARVKISPLAKKIASSLGIDFRMIPIQEDIRITKKDVLAFSKSRSESSLKDLGDRGGQKEDGRLETKGKGLTVDRIIPVTAIRRTIAEHLTLSVNTIPRAILNVRVNAENLISWKEGCASRGHKVGFTDLIIRACAVAIERHPLINSQLVGNEIRIFREINIGVAVDTEKGLMVPVIENANKKGIVSINRELREKIETVRSGAARSEDNGQSTFTVSNLGMIGVEQFIPIINPPECAILAIGAITREPVAQGNKDEIKISPIFWISLAFDHRILDGAPAARFVSELKEILEWPYAIID